LNSELIKLSSEERFLLKNLGSWLGKLTIGRNQSLRARDFDPESLIVEVNIAVSYFLLCYMSVVWKFSYIILSLIYLTLWCVLLINHIH